MANLNLLLVDDENEIREIIVEVLSGLPLTFFQAENGLVAQEVVKKNKIDFIMTDLAMPQMNGVEFLRWIKGTGLNIPCIVLTGHGDKTIAQQVRAFGVVDFIDKPFEVDILIDRVNKVAESVRSGISLN